MFADYQNLVQPLAKVTKIFIKFLSQNFFFKMDKSMALDFSGKIELTFIRRSIMAVFENRAPSMPALHII